MEVAKKKKSVFSSRRTQYAALAAVAVAGVYFYYKSSQGEKDENENENEKERNVTSKKRIINENDNWFDLGNDDNDDNEDEKNSNLFTIDFSTFNRHPSQSTSNMTTLTKFDTSVIPLKPPKPNDPKPIEEIRAMKNPFFGLFMPQTNDNDSKNDNTNNNNNDGNEMKFDLTQNIIATNDLVIQESMKNQEISNKINDHLEKMMNDNLTSNESNIFKVVSFNILANCYCKTGAYPYCDGDKLNWSHRSKKILSFLKNENAKVIGLQEVDKPHFFKKELCDNDGQYLLHYLKRSRQKQDGIMILWNKHYFNVFDDNSGIRQSHNNNVKFENMNQFGYNIELNELADSCLTENLQNHYRKDNVACYVILQSKRNPLNLIIFVNCHLYYHPQKTDVRLRQMAYILNIVHNHGTRILSQNENKKYMINMIFCGDFNSLPSNYAYHFMTNKEYRMQAQGNQTLKLIVDPCLNKVARWCRALGVDTTFYPGSNMDKTKDDNAQMGSTNVNDITTTSNDTHSDLINVSESKDNNDNNNNNNASSSSCSSLTSEENENEIENENGIDKSDKIETQDMYDPNLTPKQRRRLARDKRVKNASNHGKIDTNELFEIAKNENRYLITKSKSICARRECPPHLLLQSNDGTANLKRIIKYFGIAYDDECVYTRCTLCNGLFKQIDRNDISKHPMIPNGLKSGYDESGKKLEFYQCLSCLQTYWWGKKTESESERFQNIFNNVEKELENESKTKEETIQKHLKNSQNGNGNENENENSLSIFEERRYLNLVPNLQTYFWKDIIFVNPFFNGLNSACKMHNESNQEPKYTNKTSKFEGTLDYIFFGDLTEKNDSNFVTCLSGNVVVPNGDTNYDGPYPCAHWPSDHLPVAATFQFNTLYRN